MGHYNGRIEHRLLFAPRIKIRPREHNVGSFIRKSLYKPVNLSTSSNKFKRYADLRKDKIARIRRRNNPKKLNKWLSRRMFRGSNRYTLSSRTKIASPISIKVFNNIYTEAEQGMLSSTREFLNASTTLSRKCAEKITKFHYRGIR